MFGRVFISVAIFVATFATGLASRAEAAIMVGISAASATSDDLPVPACEKRGETEPQVLVADSGTGGGCSGAETNSLRIGSSVPGLLSPAACFLADADLVVGIVPGKSRNVPNTSLESLLEPPKV